MKKLKRPLFLHQVQKERHDDCADYDFCLSQAAKANISSFSCKGCKSYKATEENKPYVQRDRVFTPNAEDMWV
jgi:hypothetical protein